MPISITEYPLSVSTSLRNIMHPPNETDVFAGHLIPTSITILSLRMPICI